MLTYFVILTAASPALFLIAEWAGRWAEHMEKSKQHER